MKYFLIVLFWVTFASHAQIRVIEWQQLKPEIEQPEITLPSINDQQRQLLALVIQLQNDDNAQSQETVLNAIATLKQQGINAEEALNARAQYMAQAQVAAETLNTEINGNTVRMPGFIVPIEFDGVKGIEFLLVPYAGACIHLPPPPANQIVRLFYPEGFEIENIQYPVWVEGVIKTDKQTDEVYLVDGKTALTMGYSMQAKLIENYYE
ncbi:DUF3299 domain-containing protein [Agarivorans sp. MS3-6]